MKVPKDFGVRDSELKEIVIPNDLRLAKQPEDAVLAELARHGYDDDATFAVKLAMEEALTNAIKHGNRYDASKHVIVKYSVNKDRAIIMVADEGAGFRPECVPDPTCDECLERPNGRGVMLMTAYMTRVCYNECGNAVWMLKERGK